MDYLAISDSVAVSLYPRDAVVSFFLFTDAVSTLVELCFRCRSRRFVTTIFTCCLPLAALFIVVVINNDESVSIWDYWKRSRMLKLFYLGLGG